MDQVTQQNAALVEEAAAAAASLQEQTQNLTQAVSVFQINASNTAPMLAPARTITESTAVLPKQQARPVVAAPARKQVAHTAGDDWEEF